MTAIFPDILTRAADLVLRERVASPELLEKHLQVSSAQAWQLLVQLASCGVVEEPNPFGRYHVALHRLEQSVGKAPPAVAYARLLRDLAMYLLEQHGYENTRCIETLVTPLKSTKPVLQVAVARVLAVGPEQPVLAVMLELSTLPGMGVSLDSGEVRQQIELAAARAPAVTARLVQGHAARHQGLLHAVRYLQRRLLDDIDPDSRAVDHFIHPSFLPQGRAENNATHPEHVVPCALIERRAMELLCHGIPVEEVAHWIEPYVRVVWIEDQHRAKLDGPMKLKFTMPGSWRFGTGCMYERLHLLKIRFSPPAEGPACACGAGAAAALPPQSQ